MGESIFEKKLSIRDLQQGLLLPMLIGGGSLGFYGSNILTERLGQEVEQRRALERKIEILTDKVNAMDREVGIIQERARRYAR